MESNQAKPRVNGSLLSNYRGKAVCLLGMAVTTDHSGMSFQLTTSDDHKITVHLQEPLQEMVDGLTEVHGIVADQCDDVLCYNYILLPQDAAQNFDLGAYDKAIKMMHGFKEHYFTF